MKNLIKIIIALAFMAMSFFLGKYLADEKSAVEHKGLKDSLIILKQMIDTINEHKHLPLSKKTIDVKSKGKARSENAY